MTGLVPRSVPVGRVEAVRHYIGDLLSGCVVAHGILAPKLGGLDGSVQAKIQTSRRIGHGGVMETETADRLAGLVVGNLGALLGPKLFLF